MTIRVLLADDQAMVRTGFRLILESEDDIAVIGEAGDGDDAIAAVRRLRPDIALMDIQMPRTEEYARRAPSRSRATAHERLTKRELEVLRLLAAGMNNAELAAELHLGEGTVKTHVSSMLSKLGLRDRVQAVVYAYENGLVDRDDH